MNNPWKFLCVCVDEEGNISSSVLAIEVFPSAHIMELKDEVFDRIDPTASVYKKSRSTRLWKLFKDLRGDIIAPDDLQKAVSDLSLPDSDSEDLVSVDVEELNLFKKVHDYWEMGPKEGCLHLVVQILQPSQGFSNKRSRDDDDIIQVVKRIKKDLCEAAPSDLARHPAFREIVGSEKCLGLNRPFEHDTIPITLLHPAFGIFKDRCKAAPSYKALVCLSELSVAGCYWFDSESSRSRNIGIVIETHFHLKFLSASGFNGTGNEEGRPLHQAVEYYFDCLIRALEHRNRWYDHDTCFPCVLVIHMGTQLGFYGALWDGNRVRVEPLTRDINLMTHWHEKRERLAMASTLDALVETYQSIRTHYASIKALAGARTPKPNSHIQNARGYPYLRSYHDDGQQINFTYTNRLCEDKLVFTATVDPPGSGECIVKFATQYSVAAHEYLALYDLAPQLRKSVRISSDWTAIIMERSNYKDLHRCVLSKTDQDKVHHKVQSLVQKLHEGGFVHGDICNANLLVDPASLTSDDVRVHLIDFDWAGRIGEARYPDCVSVKRPEGAKSGDLIATQHDDEMVSYLF